jgi:ribosomal protein S18 acetylase RimI-like enzyme
MPSVVEERGAAHPPNTPSLPAGSQANIVVRRATCLDWPALARLFPVLFPEVNARGVSYRLRHGDNVTLVARRHRRLAGFCHFIEERLPGVAWLDYLGVHPQLRRSGVGERLLGEFERHAAARGLRRTELTVLKANRAAIAFYERNGYAPVRDEDAKFVYAKALAPPRAAAITQPRHAYSASLLARLYRRALYFVLVDSWSWTLPPSRRADN